ncbi:aconitate hydratase [Acinetobacter baumannii]|nr:aconitate hydratase [Acinetobacter baumannii]
MVTDYFDSAKLTAYLEELGFNLVGYGCTTCIGNSGPLPDPIEQAIKEGDLTVGAVLSGNRNFEGRIHPLVKTNWLASPPLVVAYALAGSMKIDLTKEPLGEGNDGQPVYLKDIWPSSQDIAQAVEEVRTEMFHKEYGEVFDGDANWQAIQVTGSATYQWQEDLYPPSAVLQHHEGEAGSGAGHQGCAHSGDSGRFGDHRPHFAGGQHQARQPGGALPERARRGAAGL